MGVELISRFLHQNLEGGGLDWDFWEAGLGSLLMDMYLSNQHEGR